VDLEVEVECSTLPLVMLTSGGCGRGQKVDSGRSTLKSRSGGWDRDVHLEVELEVGRSSSERARCGRPQSEEDNKQNKYGSTNLPPAYGSIGKKSKAYDSTNDLLLLYL
jgi:hypothetical protein